MILLSSFALIIIDINYMTYDLKMWEGLLTLLEAKVKVNIKILLRALNII